MKNNIVLYLLITTCCMTFLNAQNSYTINGETLELNTEVEGALDLLWTVSDGAFRYFVKTKDAQIIELKNTKVNGKYDNAYIKTLNDLCSNSGIVADKVTLTTGSLKRFIDKYNKSVDINYNVRNKDLGISFRLGVFGGITNHPLVNLNSVSTFFQIATELELFGDTDNPRHSGFVKVRQSFGSDTDYKTTEFALGYRFRIVKKERFNLYIQNQFANLNIFSDGLSVNDSFGNTTNGSAFDVPFIFGIGADFKISETGYLSLIYDNFYAINIDNNNAFPTDILIGYKFNL